MLSMHGMLSTRGKSKLPLNSLFILRPIGLSHEAGEIRFVRLKPKLSLSLQRTEKRKVNPSYEAAERRRVCQRATALLKSNSIYSFLCCK